MNQITMRQAHAVLRDMGIFNLAESVIEEDANEETIRRWRRPSEVIGIDDPIILKIKSKFGLPQSNLETFFRTAAKKPGGPQSGALVISGGTTMAEPGEPKWLSLARSYVGIKEVPGTGSNKKIEDFFKDAGFPGYKDDTAWCAAFVGAVMKRSGYPALGSLAARDGGKYYGTKLDKPKIGCIVVMWRGSPSSWQGHIGFVTGINWTNRTLKVLGGNQSDKVSEETYPMSRVIKGGYRWPVAPTIKALKAAGSTEAKASQAAKVTTQAVIAYGVGSEVVQADPPWMPSLELPEIDAVSAITDRLYGWVHLFNENSNLVLIVIGVGLYFIVREWQNNRLERAQRGFPILKEDIEASEVTDA